MVDIFDTNAYAHDPRSDFLNWSIIDSAAFDYAGNAWSYTYGIATQWYQGRDAFRLGLFDLSIVPGSAQLDPHILPQFQLVAEQFFNAGGLGILVGDGQLPQPGSERLVETYYSFSLTQGVRV